MPNSQDSRLSQTDWDEWRSNEVTKEYFRYLQYLGLQEANKIQQISHREKSMEQIGIEAMFIKAKLDVLERLLDTEFDDLTNSRD